MVTVRAACPQCGDVDMPSSAVTMDYWPNHEERSTYQFTCPKCREMVQKPATAEVRRLLMPAHGVVVREHTVVIPAEALEVHVGPPITLDDLIDLHEWMDVL